MHVLITKYYLYEGIRADTRFSYDIAFKRVNSLLANVRESFSPTAIKIIVPDNELIAARAHIPLRPTEHITMQSKAVADNNFFASSLQLLVFDEQAFYASSELITRVLQTARGAVALWDDPERLLWSYNYHDSCRFFVAPAGSVKKAISAARDFSSLQQLACADNIVNYYHITPKDIPHVYKKAAFENPYPYHYYLEPTSRCNSNCIMCPFHSTDPRIAQGRLYVGDKGDDMPLDTFRGLVDEITSIGWQYLPHYRIPQITAQARGEPTMAPQCREMFAYVKEKGLRLSFTTNGSTLHQDNLAEFLIDIGTDEIIISIDGDQEEYSKIRPRLNYRQVVDNLIRLRKLRDKKGLLTPTIYTKRVRRQNSTDKADRKYLDTFTRYADWSGIGFENYDDFKTEAKGYSGYFFDVDPSKRIPCIWATDVSMVKANGKVDMCFGASEHYIGDIYQSSLLSILKNSPLRKTILQGHSEGTFDITPFCRKCTSWKHNFHITSGDDTYVVRKNAVLAYWQKKQVRDGAPQKVAPKNSFFAKLRTLFRQ